MLKLEGKNANTANGIKTSTFLKNSWGMVLYLTNVPLNATTLTTTCQNMGSFDEVVF